ncbi:MAG TPA: PQQ-binding-like beta-propeller repeat protein [Candidatus Eremiobacteraceae bacterium]|nr:PQQ-binding-like beta-propeller repeat protein [Candidatus Eremiobacteraceae bacterium]
MDSVKFRALLIVFGLALLPGCATSSSGSTTGTAAASDSGPNSTALLAALQDNSNWSLPAKSYSGNRYTGLTQINESNVGSLRKAWVSKILDDGQQESSPIVWHGAMYIVTPHNNVLAFNASNGKLFWQFPYNPAYVLLYAVNRGAGIADGKIFLGTQDCRVIALDASSGKQVWNVQGCHDTSNSWYSMGTYVYKNNVILGTAGGDTGNMGIVSAFDANTGARTWDWQTIDKSTWPGKSWQHGGAAVWAGMAFDQSDDTLFVAPGNPGPDMVPTGREGADLYSNSLVALDISSAQPKVKWYYQLIANDTHDADPAMIPVVFDGKVNGAIRKLVAIGDKNGNFVILDRANGHVVYRTSVSTQKDDEAVPTLAGTPACPNHGGGIEWNGGSYDPGSNLFLIPSTEECATFKILTEHPQYVAGLPYAGGPLPKRQNGTGTLTAIDISTGKVAWRIQVPYPSQGGVLVTKTGIAFISDLRGRIYALDAKTGKELWHDDTGSQIVAPLSAYSTGGTQYIATLVGQAGNQHTPNLPPSAGSYAIAYSLNVKQPVINDIQGQTGASPVGNATASVPTTQAAAVGAPYTPAQVTAGKKVYENQCLSCHGAQLQGVSAPALTGPSFGHAQLNVSAVRTIVTQQMPLTAPGSLTPDQYAAAMAYLMAYNCIKPANGGTKPFPTSDVPANKIVTFTGATCPIK